MAIMRIHVYVIALIIISGTKVVAQSIPPPSNVSITCDSYKVEVHWEYPNLKDVFFLVELQDYTGKESQNTSDHWINISKMLKNPAYNRYVVYVTAVQGKMSNKSESDIFSFNENAPSTIKCRLDFPEVSLSAKGGKLHLEFPNPLHLYKNTPALRNNTDKLVYSAETEEFNITNKVKDSCGFEFETCKTSIAIAEEREEYCVNLTGTIGQRSLTDKKQQCFKGDLKSSEGAEEREENCVNLTGTIGKRSLKDEKPLCFKGDLNSYPPFTTYLYPVLGVVLTLLFITTIITLLGKRCNQKIKKKAAMAFPNFLVFKPTQTHLCKPLNVEAENVARDLQILPVTCDKDPTQHTKLIEFSDDEDKPSEGQSSEHYDMNAEDGDLKDIDTSSIDMDAGDSTGGLSSGYDCPHALRLEMSPGDLVEGYRA
ncbi:interferon gamma receptor 1 isoform X1 [Paramisgurnus dabryanus]|uniref:interferon gamma receptor 1 isoform X1 n=1 Tax=Paramisgurnus dabryanus TaxID=90735 RepID=UPI003CCFBA16